MGGRIVGAMVLGVTRHSVFMQELHSTKGWRLPALVRRERFGGRPMLGRFHRAPSKPHMFGSDAGRWMRNRPVHPLHPDDVDLMAHGWYRRKIRLADENL
jgi:hypothetical protein